MAAFRALIDNFALSSDGCLFAISYHVVDFIKQCSICMIPFGLGRCVYMPQSIYIVNA